MSNSYMFREASKKNVYSSLLGALISGVILGFGIFTIIVPRIILQGIMDINPTVGINAEPYATIHLFGAFLIMFGVLSFILDIFLINRSLRTPIIQSQPPPPPASMEKKYCRYCGTANSKDAVYCEKCGKNIAQ